MPILRVLDGERIPSELLLDVSDGGDGMQMPLTLGSDPAGDDHIHLADASLEPRQAQLLGSGASRAYAFVLRGTGVQVNSRPLNDLRVLRHGDQIQIGRERLLYLDFVPRTLEAGSQLIGLRCSQQTCGQPLELDDEAVSCPWCGAAHHAGCWLKLPQCAALDCYPVRQALLADLKGQVQVSRLHDETATSTSQLCAAHSERQEELRPDEQVIRCPDPNCGIPFHPGCWLSIRSWCPGCRCTTDSPCNVPHLLDRLVFQRNQARVP